MERRAIQVAGDVRRIAPEERRQGAPTPGMIREEAVATDRLWAGLGRDAIFELPLKNRRSGFLLNLDRPPSRLAA